MKLHIMFGILSLLLRHDKLTARQIANSMEISVRTVRRYLDAMALEVPLVTERGVSGGVHLPANYRFPYMFFTYDEMRVLQQCLLSVQGLSEENSGAYKKIQDKLDCIAPLPGENTEISQDVLLIDHCPWNSVPDIARKLSDFENAAKQRLPVDIEYHSRESDFTHRTVEPHLLVLKAGEWYVYAYCRLKSDFRLFKLSRVAKLSTLDKKFDRRGIDRSSLNFLINQGAPALIDVRFSLSPDIRTEVEEWLSIENVHEDKDGQLFASAMLADDRQLVAKILSFRDKLRVVAPAALTKRVLAEVAAIKQLYS